MTYDLINIIMLVRVQFVLYRHPRNSGSGSNYCVWSLLVCHYPFVRGSRVAAQLNLNLPRRRRQS